ncbi:Glycosyl transferases group 1 [Klenkia soli]|uniref:Glycosyl transferases group 1 n=1 Tax=Klenkia soli TaxID=1052260 RepID=A0A1H0NWS6_9ACTN|nr:Glycosyl transferases group 1 [Klenkia soli]
MTTGQQRRLLIIQYAGDYRDAYRQWTEYGTESYYGHAYVLQTLSEIASRDQYSVEIICCISNGRYVEKLPNGITVVGADTDPNRDPDQIVRLAREFAPTHVILHAPVEPLLSQLVSEQFRLACIWADSFGTNRLRRLVKFGRLARVAASPSIEFIANHNVAACLSTRTLGVAATRIVPWDWPHAENVGPHRTRRKGTPFVCLFVGSLDVTKGVADAVAATKILAKTSANVTLRVVGGPVPDYLRHFAEQQLASSKIDFVGKLSNAAVKREMGQADAVVIPSHHRYPEGLPLTVYEALQSRTPIIASDHPMLIHYLRHDRNALIFPAGSSRELATQLRRLIDDEQLWGKLSNSSEQTWRDIQISLKWGQLVRHWLDSDVNQPAWIERLSLSAMYPEQRHSN